MYPSLQERLLTQHLALSSIIRSLSDTQLARQPQPDKWSVLENIAHLAAYQLQFIRRLHRIQETQEPVFEPYVGDYDPAFLERRARPAQALLQELAADRQQIIQLLQGLDKEQWQRSGIHTRYGKMNVEEWTEFFLLHEAHHLFTIFRLVHV